MRQTSTKAAIKMIQIHRAQSKVIFESDLKPELKILVLKQLNISCEMFLGHENCYFGYLMPELTRRYQDQINYHTSKEYLNQPEYYMHHYQARVKVAAHGC